MKRFFFGEIHNGGVDIEGSICNILVYIYIYTIYLNIYIYVYLYMYIHDFSVRLSVVDSC